MVATPRAVLIFACTVWSVLSLVCLWHLWFRQKGTLRRKAGWSVIVTALPLIGAFMYGSVYDGLEPTHATDRARYTSGISSFGGGFR